MRQYSIDSIELGWNGLDFAEGMAAGSTIVESKTSPNKSLKTQARGQGIVSKNPDRSGTLTVLVNQTSQLHQSLVAISNADDVVGAKITASSGLLNDLVSGSVTNYQSMFILESPDVSYATEETDLSWVFGFERKFAEPNENVDNVIGG